jgi:hypothetical protein
MRESEKKVACICIILVGFLNFWVKVLAGVVISTASLVSFSSFFFLLPLDVPDAFLFGIFCTNFYKLLVPKVARSSRSCNVINGNSEFLFAFTRIPGARGAI